MIVTVKAVFATVGIIPGGVYARHPSARPRHAGPAGGRCALRGDRDEADGGAARAVAAVRRGIVLAVHAAGRRRPRRGRKCWGRLEDGGATPARGCAAPLQAAVAHTWLSYVRLLL